MPVTDTSPSSVRAARHTGYRLTFDCHGALVEIRVTDPALLERVRAVLPPGARLVETGAVDVVYSWTRGRTRASPSGVHLVARAGETVARTASLSQALAALASDVQFRVAMHAPRRVFVHSGVVAWNGRAIVIPGYSYSGKTSLTAALVRSGATYYSDEYAVLDEYGWVHPFPRHLALRHADGTPAGSVPAEALGGQAGTDPIRIGVVLWTSFRPGAEWRPTAISPAAAALALLEHTVVARLRPADALGSLARAIEPTVVAWRGVRGEAEHVARWVLDGAGCERPGTGEL